MVRLKARYILFDILYPPTTKPLERYSERDTLLALHSTSPGLSSRTIADIVRKQIQIYFGDHGAGVVGLSLMVKYFSPKTSTGIIRCSRDHYQLVCAALTMINSIGSKDVIVRVVRVSGTIKKCEQAAVERNRDLMRLMEKQYDDEEEKEIMNIEEDEEDRDD
ncbi:CYFA0S15e01574g1_1 [Cyberlindnera fabianii]|uniref:Ribonuclease P/MRP protein subunit POP5 n=1 Tax=Cyberlindnera fabianii TaxID=36022 RepID=A0A061B5D5_CYBFA|nr:CYFA0S15e01574g1_1 [Cyberlindnera fabianii]